MSKADEMFEKLGYEKRKYSNGDIFYFQYNGSREKFGFEFCKDKYNKNESEIYPVCYGENDEAITITMKELQAINEKVKELGWNE